MVLSLSCLAVLCVLEHPHYLAVEQKCTQSLKLDVHYIRGTGVPYPLWYTHKGPPAVLLPSRVTEPSYAAHKQAPSFCAASTTQIMRVQPDHQNLQRGAVQQAVFTDASPYVVQEGLCQGCLDDRGTSGTSHQLWRERPV